MKKKPTKNSELLSEINKSKATFTFFTNPREKHYDIYTESELDSLNTDMLSVGIIVRKPNWDHIPKKIETESATKEKVERFIKLNFPPYSHWKWDGKQWNEVARSHWRGQSLDTGEFCMTHGQITDRLGEMYMTMTEGLASRGNWRGYSYVDEMREHALMELILHGLKYNEGYHLMKGQTPNPFAYLTTTMTRGFQAVLAKEKTKMEIASELAAGAGYKMLTPAQEADIEKRRYDGTDWSFSDVKTKRGRKSNKIKKAMAKIEGKKPERKPRERREATMFFQLFNIIK